jgi:hypothetical protein
MDYQTMESVAGDGRVARSAGRGGRAAGRGATGNYGGVREGGAGGRAGEAGGRGDWRTSGQGGRVGRPGEGATGLGGRAGRDGRPSGRCVRVGEGAAGLGGRERERPGWASGRERPTVRRRDGWRSRGCDGVRDGGAQAIGAGGGGSGDARKTNEVEKEMVTGIRQLGAKIHGAELSATSATRDANLIGAYTFDLGVNCDGAEVRVYFLK